MTQDLECMTLNDLIIALASLSPTRRFALGFGNPHSYRGFYECVAFEPQALVTVGEMLESARSAMGTTYGGWKGGEYVMSGNTPCFVSIEGETGMALSGELFNLLFSVEATQAHPTKEDGE